MRRLLAAMWLALLATTAAAFPTDLEIEAEGLAISASTESDGRLAFIHIDNREAFAVRCEAAFRNGPEVGRVRRATLEAAESRTLSWMPRRQVIRVRVVLSCAPLDAR